MPFLAAFEYIREKQLVHTGNAVKLRAMSAASSG
jgi:hypothetical protein